MISHFKETRTKDVNPTHFPNENLAVQSTSHNLLLHIQTVKLFLVSAEKTPIQKTVQQSQWLRTAAEFLSRNDYILVITTLKAVCEELDNSFRPCLAEEKSLPNKHSSEAE